MGGGWRVGFGLNPRIVGLAPFAALVVGGLGIVLTPSGDIREGLFPWGVASACVLLATTALGVLVVHPTPPARSMLVGAWWSALALCGIAGFFVAIGIGGLLGIDENTDNPLALLPVAAMAFGLLSMMPAMATLLISVRAANRIPQWARNASWLIVPVLPALLILGGLAEGTVETIGSLLLLASFAAGWVTLGLGVRSAA